LVATASSGHAGIYHDVRARHRRDGSGMSVNDMESPTGIMFAAFD
jgi:hypothetical protein